MKKKYRKQVVLLGWEFAKLMGSIYALYIVVRHLRFCG